MNKLKKLTTACLLTTSLLSFNTIAVMTDANSSGYTGIGIGKTTWSNSAIGYNFSYDKMNFKAFIGKKLENNFAIEGNFFNIASDAVISVNGINLLMSGTSIGVAGLYNISTTNKNFTPFVKLGMHKWDIRVTVKRNGVEAYAIDTNGTDIFYGVGVNILVNKGHTIRTEFESFTLDNNDKLNNFSLSYIKEF